MNEKQVSALFLLAGIEVISMTRIANQYWPDKPDYKDYRENSPWWLVTIPQGVLTIGWRSRVISVDWSGTGIVFPLIDPEGRDLHSFRHPIRSEDVTKWPTGGHAYGYGPTVELLTALRHNFETYKYLKQYYKDHPDKPEDRIEWLVRGELKEWANLGEKEVEVTISAKHKSHAIEEFYRTHPNYKMVNAWEKEEMMQVRKEFEDRHLASICRSDLSEIVNPD